MKSSTLGTKLHTNAFSCLFSFFDFQTAPDIVNVCFVVAHWNTGEHSGAQEEMSMIIDILKKAIYPTCIDSYIQIGCVNH